MVDHAIPIKILRQEFSKLQSPSIPEIRAFLLKRYKLGVITKTEDNKLNQNQLRSDMPKNWNGENWRARYEEIGITQNLNH